MKKQRSIFSKALLYSIIGLCIQALLAGILLAVIFIWQHRLSMIVFWTACAGLPVWMHLIVSYVLFGREAYWDMLFTNEDDNTARQTIINRRNRVRILHHFYRKYLIPFLEIGIIFLLILWSFPFAQLTIDELSPVKNRLLLLISLYAVTAVGLIIAWTYYRKLLQFKSFNMLKSGIQFLFAMALLFCMLGLGLLFDYFTITLVSQNAYWFFTVFNSVLAAEIAFSIIIQFFRPRTVNEMVRPAFDSYLLESLMEPRSTRKTFAGMVRSLFGFDVSETAFVRAAVTYSVPVIAASIILMMAMTSLVIVRPHQQAVILSFGNIRAKTLNPGIHFKLPWPVDEARIENVREIRRVHVGSHQSAKQGDDVYREGVPILWTNKHGVIMDALLIIAAPKQLIKEAHESGSKIDSVKHKTPSISLVGADIYIEYKISNLVDYIRSAANPELLLKKLAEAQASRLLYRFDIDTLFCDARLAMADLLRNQVQNECDRNKLGIEIIHAGVTAVHPPLEVAETFEATVAAQQERETKIQQARQSAVSVQVETSGSSEQFIALADLINKSESGLLKESSNIEQLLYQCGGKVSRIISGAYAYRWGREFSEHGKISRFKNEAVLYNTAPKNYRYSRYLDILGQGLADSRKMVLLGNHDEMLIRMTLPREGPKKLPDNLAEYTQ